MIVGAVWVLAGVNRRPLTPKADIKTVSTDVR
jgi:hypothetical protein